MSHFLLRRDIVAFAVVILLAPAVAQAVSISEYFDYGSTGAEGVTLGDLGSAGDGWAGAWATEGSPNYFRRDAADNLGYTAAGYSNFGNEGADSGKAAFGGISAASTRARSFSASMGETIWVSVLAMTTASTGGALLWFQDTASANFIRLQGDGGTSGTASARLRYNNVNTSGSPTLALNVTGLLLAKITINYEGAFDSISLWLNPDLSNGEAGLGAALLGGSGADAYGNGLSGVRVSFDSGGSLDAIRISNDPDAFAFVTTGVPEPSIWVLIGVGGFFLLNRLRLLRRRS